MNKIFSLLILISACAAGVFAQQTKNASNNPGQTTEWVRLQSETGEFSAEMPADFDYFFDKDGFTFDDSDGLFNFRDMRLLTAAAEKTVMRVEIYKVSSPKKYLKQLLERDGVEGDQGSESLEGYTIKQVRVNKKKDGRTQKDVEINYVSRYIASKSYLYVVTVANRGAQTPAAVRFLSSVRLSQPSTDKTVVNLSSLNPLTIQQIGEFVKEDKKTEAEPKEKTQTPRPVEKNENSILILSKPFAGYTDAARNTGTSGTVTLRVTFAKNGGIPRIGVIESLANGLTRSAFFSALRIRFIPQEKENEFVNATKTVSYSFSIG
jgi:hypothetical protein